MTGIASIIVGDARKELARLPERVYHCAITSPPYYRLRDYKDDRQIGLEKTVEEYIESIVDVARGVRRGLRDDAVFWINIGDSYATAPKTNNRGQDKSTLTSTRNQAAGALVGMPKGTNSGAKRKDMLCIPWAAAMALRDDGWYLRAAMPWVKRSSMPSPMKDRPCSSLEYVFMLTKKPDYYFDPVAVQVAARTGSWEAMPPIGGHRHAGSNGNATYSGNTPSGDGSRSWRDSDLYFESLSAPHGLIMAGDEPVGLDCTSQPYTAAFCLACETYFPSGARELDSVEVDGKRRPLCPCGRHDAWLDHFAMFPPNLVRPLIMASTSERGCCSACGAPFVRKTEKSRLTRKRHYDFVKRTGEAGTGNSCGNTVAGTRVKTLGWVASCECENTSVVPCRVIDPFSGMGTTAMVAAAMCRDATGIELNPDYAKASEARIRHELSPETFRNHNKVADSPLFASAMEL